MNDIATILLFIIQIAWFFVIAHVIMSWLISFQVLNIRQPLVYQLWQGLNAVLEPIYRPIRRFLPITAGLDLAPLVLIVILFALQQFLT